MKKQSLKFIDLFAGLGGFHLALNELGCKCVFASELHADLRHYYELNFNDINPKHIVGDIHKYDVTKIPSHDILCAGFPCQPFSQAGKRKGLSDPNNGNHFNKILEILLYHKPKYIFLENVPNLDSHDNGKTWLHIRDKLSKSYDIDKSILSPHEFGIPQNRKRVYIVGKRKENGGLNGFNFKFNRHSKSTHINSILEKGPKDFLQLKDISKKQINTWQSFLDKLSIDEVPRFPIWAAEFGATYPFEEKATIKYNFEELKFFRGQFGEELSGITKNEIIKNLPRYAQTDQPNFPEWKKNYIRRNREFYDKHKKWLDEWKKEIIDWKHSHQKFEWNCGNIELNIKGKIIQFRPSGIRVKKPETSPALVLTSTQIPIIYDDVIKDFRYMTINEAAKLQSMERLKYKPTPISRAFSAFGNAVNVTVVGEIAKKLIK